ncbi:MAG: hypothetical protein ACJ0BO_06585 [Candidatus Puniceispirillaceae bacterium]
MLDEGYEIRFDSGNFDAETLNMQITNFEVLKNGTRFWNADAISLETTLLADGRTLIVKNLEIDSFVSLVNKLKVGSIIARNFTLDKYDHLLAGKISSLSDHALDNAYLGMFDFWAPVERGAGYETFVQSIELTPVRRTTKPSGSSYINQIGMRGLASVKNRQLHGQDQVLTTDNIAGYDLVTHLSLQNFEIAFDIENVLIKEVGVMRSQLSGHVDIKNHFSTDIEFDAQIPLPIFWEIMKHTDSSTFFTGEFGDEVAQSFLASLFQSDAALSKVSLSLRDYGTLGRLLNLYAKHSGQSVTKATDDIRLKIDQWMKGSIPNERMHLFPAIDKFLDHGGQLRFSATPDAPVPVLLFASYLLMPESAIDQLNVMIEQWN